MNLNLVREWIGSCKQRSWYEWLLCWASYEHCLLIERNTRFVELQVESWLYQVWWLHTVTLVFDEVLFCADTDPISINCVLLTETYCAVKMHQISLCLCQLEKLMCYFALFMIVLSIWPVHQGPDAGSAVHSQQARPRYDRRSPGCGDDGVHSAAQWRVWPLKVIHPQTLAYQGELK